tara:strand:- start:1910 stop:2101 length:192 start_codon:yes stop_codon:yes gene_type:complete
MGREKFMKRKQLNRTERFFGSEKIKKKCLGCQKTFLAENKHIFICHTCKNSRRGNIQVYYEGI